MTYTLSAVMTMLGFFSTVGSDAGPQGSPVAALLSIAIVIAAASNRPFYSGRG